MQNFKKDKNISIQLLLIIGLLIVASMFYKYASAVYKDYQIESEIKRLNREVAELKKENEELEELIEYLDTNAYKEIIAKGELNMRKPGEIVVAIKESEAHDTGNKEVFTPDSAYTYIPIYKKWIRLFWGN